MELNKEFDTEIGAEKPNDSLNLEPFSQKPSNKNSYPLIAGILLIIAGILALFNWGQFFLLDATTIESFFDISQIQVINPSITYDQILGFLQTCAIIGIIISIFPILGGILAIKKKQYYIAIATSVIGLFTIGIIFTSSVLSLIGLILLVLSKQNFQ
ncbi:MAG: hypothetical protein AYK22_02915 [Thermoplasmatales archaeon SG8-52-3]|nr:MAG: hypothetical protein AYK22_02915 [Thermoplasmatales archaeon SG8-52-3]